jgi:glycosyltransferase involved in cell wall biosynthesis
MPPMARVSIIIPTHNRRGLLACALGSVARQTFRDFEALVIDDGSEEDIASVCATADVPVRCIRISHAGVAAARNAGIEAAGGEYLAFLDSDDAWLPEHLARTVAVLQDRPEVGVVYHPYRTVDEQGRAVPQRPTPSLPGGVITRDLLAHDVVTTPSVVCRRDLVRQVGGFDPALTTGEDYDLFLRLSRVCQFAALPEALLLRRLHEGNISKQQRVQTAVRHALLKERFCRQHPDVMTSLGLYAGHQLAKSFYRAGRLLLRAGHRRQARQFLRRSLHYRPLYPRAIFWLAVAACPLRSDAGSCPQSSL